ncbi:MAG: thioredoxin domain-containing protein, partial [Acidobacteriota bacterium]
MPATERRNRLADEISPYLLQHADNPVDWYPWGEEALGRARREDRPILLSVGYAACHWCHVMEHESFEDPETAELMNEHFVCIKVDREERPDIDEIYMRAVQMMTGRGGWPLTVFLTPDLEPFYGGTYYPPEDRPGMPSFEKVLRGIAEAWEERRDEVEGMGGRLREQLQPAPTGGGDGAEPSEALLQRAAMELQERFDPNHGGFGDAPKFPNPTAVALLLRHGARRGDQDLMHAATFTLDQMAAGGIHDHVGGGFHRYCTDARWLVPHFEKMLYDNALLVMDYLDAYQLTGEDRHAGVVRDTLDWVLREMRQPRGGFSSTLDADSEGVEGKFYVWDREEIEELLGDEAELFCAAYDVTSSGNWEGHNILHLPRRLDAVAREAGEPEEAVREQLRRNLETLRRARAERVRPGLDDKVLVDWNGLMIAAMARAGRVLGERRYGEAAGRAADFLLEELVRDGRLLHAWRDGEARVRGYLDDHADLVWG